MRAGGGGARGRAPLTRTLYHTLSGCQAVQTVFPVPSGFLTQTTASNRPRPSLLEILKKPFYGSHPIKKFWAPDGAQNLAVFYGSPFGSPFRFLFKLVDY